MNEFPISDEKHIRDKLAKKNLQEFFPMHWKLSRLEDIDSGIEYGVDWVVQVTNDSNQLPGIMFCMSPLKKG